MSHELHKSIPEHCLGSLDKMWSQESIEIVRTIVWVSQHFSGLAISCAEMFLRLNAFSVQVRVFQVPTLSWHANHQPHRRNSKETGPSTICRGNLRGRLLSHEHFGLLKCSSHCISIMLVPSICPTSRRQCRSHLHSHDLPIMGSNWSSPSMRDHSSATT